MVDVDVLVMAKMSVMDVAVARPQFRIELWLTCVPMVNYVIMLVNL